MPVTGSGQIRLRADVNEEINGNDTDSNVSLRSLSSDAGESVPDALSEFYGYSSMSAPSITYNSQSSDYTTITLNVTVNWNGHSSGTYKLECEIYSSSSLGTNLYETVTASTASGSAPSGDQSVQFTITPTSQYKDDDQDYRLKIKATNQIGTTTETGNDSGYRSASVTQATQYTWKVADQGYYRGWRYHANTIAVNNNSCKSGSYFREQMNHPQLGWYTTHQTTTDGDGNEDYTGAVYVSNVTYSGTYSSMYSIADKTNSSNGVYHRGIYPDSVSAGSRPNRKRIMHWKIGSADIYNYSNNSFGMKHTNHSETAMGTDYNNYQASLDDVPSLLANPSGEYGWSGTNSGNAYNGTQHSIYKSGAGIGGTITNDVLEISVVYS